MFRLYDFKQRFLRGACRCAVVGDSINSDVRSTSLPYGWQRVLQPTAWTGWGVSGPTGNPAISSYPAIGGYSNTGFGTTAPGATPSGGAGDAAVAVGKSMGDTGVLGADVGSFSTIFRQYMTATDRSHFQGSDWAGVVGLKCRAMLYRGALGVSKWGFAVTRDQSQDQTADFNVSIASGYNQVDLTFPATHVTEDAVWTMTAASPNIDETGLNGYLQGVRWFTTETGLEMSFLSAVGGAHVADFTDTARVSDAALAAYVSAFNLNTIIVWVGENDTIDATWNTKMLALLARWRAAIGVTFKALVITTYQTSGTNAAKVAAIDAYLLAISQAWTDVSFLSVGGIDAGYALANGLLADTVHPVQDTGGSYLVGIVNTAIVNATPDIVVASPRATDSAGGRFPRNRNWR